MVHIPVLLAEVLDILSSCYLTSVFDGTCGYGGHAKAILDAHPEIVRYVACDRDAEALTLASTYLHSFASKVMFYHDLFSSPPAQPKFFDAILLDLGVSSMQLDTPERGFSFLREGPLDMRMDREGQSAEEIVNTWDRVSLEKIFLEYGEEKKARKAADAIVRARNRHPLHTTVELAEVVSQVLPRRGRIHPATKIFQALRIAVNEELEILQQAIPCLANRLSTAGRFLIITFHSLEDRIVKKEFRKLIAAGCFEFLCKKPIFVSHRETMRNPRARSAKLRIVQKIS